MFLSQAEKERIALATYSFSTSILEDEEVTFDALLDFASKNSSVLPTKEVEFAVLDFMRFAGEDKATLDAITDETLADKLISFSDSFSDDNEAFATIDSFIDNSEVTADKVCDARHKLHVQYNADGGKTKICKLKKGAIKKRRTIKQKLADARRRNKKQSSLTKMKRKKAMSRRSK